MLKKREELILSQKRQANMRNMNWGRWKFETNKDHMMLKSFAKTLENKLLVEINDAEIILNHILQNKLKNKLCQVRLFIEWDDRYQLIDMQNFTDIYKWSWKKRWNLLSHCRHCEKPYQSWIGFSYAILNLKQCRNPYQIFHVHYTKMYGNRPGRWSLIYWRWGDAGGVSRVGTIVVVEEREFAPVPM